MNQKSVPGPSKFMKTPSRPLLSLAQPSPAYGWPQKSQGPTV